MKRGRARDPVALRSMKPVDGVLLQPPCDTKGSATRTGQNYWMLRRVLLSLDFGVNRMGGRLTLGERILLAFARDPNEPEIGGTANYTLDNCLHFALKTVPDLAARIRGKRVLDFGCGYGWQAVALSRLGAAEVWGLDIVPEVLEFARGLAARHGADVHFVNSIPEAVAGAFDVVLSISAFEHFADPPGMVEKMRAMAAPGGSVIITWAEPWYSHSGSHFGNYTRIPGTNLAIPWCNLWFSDQALLTLRSRFRPDRPARIEDIAGGLNRMTIARFEHIMRSSGMPVEVMRVYATLGLPLVTRIPVLRELFSSAATCILRAPGHQLVIEPSGRK